MKLFTFIRTPWPSPPRAVALAIARRAKVDHVVQLLNDLGRPDLAFLLERGLPHINSDRNNTQSTATVLSTNGGIRATATVRT